MDRLIYGGIAQLGERLNGIQEVSGSIPLISTKVEKHTKRCAFLFSFGGVEPHPPSPSGCPFQKDERVGASLIFCLWQKHSIPLISTTGSSSFIFCPLKMSGYFLYALKSS